MILTGGCDADRLPSRSHDLKNKIHPSLNLSVPEDGGEKPSGKAAASRATSSPSVAGDPMVRDLTRLLRKAKEEEIQSDFPSALETRSRIHELLIRHHGVGSWQAKNAQLAMQNVTWKMKMSERDRRLIGDAERAARQGQVMIAQSRKAEAVTAFAQAATLSQEIWPPNSHPVAHYLFAEAEARRIAADFSSAERLYRRVIEVKEKIYGPRHPDYAEALASLGMLYHDMDRDDDSLALLTESAELINVSLGSLHPKYADQLMKLSIVTSSLGRYHDALTLLEQCEEIRYRAAGPETAAYAEVLQHFGDTYVLAKDFDAAVDHYRQAADVFERTLGLENILTTRTLDGLATAYFLRKDFANSEVVLRRLAESRAKTLGENHIDFARALFRLGVVMGHQRKFPPGEFRVARAVEVMEQHLGPRDPELVRAYEIHSRLLGKVKPNRVEGSPEMEKPLPGD